MESHPQIHHVEEEKEQATKVVRKYSDLQLKKQESKALFKRHHPTALRGGLSDIKQDFRHGRHWRSTLDPHLRNKRQIRQPIRGYKTYHDKKVFTAVRKEVEHPSE
ncbi:hypothetical protein ADUPG1_009282 [Aduncisulcus paluster]|uniref:Uncharacterized protein n=1 Tax=Aduncisulcus paluster TaxID=2918883 RepID=A0ABQ5KUZ8_9EUKA|nr:hypothetical protein ADUPG1_009282 [Aduncisulcus paluster]